MSKNSMSKKININFEDYKKLSEINLLELFLKESIILETIKEGIPESSKDKELLIKSWSKKFDKKITNELIDFPLKWSTIPFTKGFSGPTTNNSISFSVQSLSNSEKLSRSKLTFSAIKPVPALPGKQKILDTFFDLLSI